MKDIRLRRRRTMVAMAAVFSASGFIMLQVREDLAHYFDLYSALPSMLALSLIAYGASIFLMMYLKGDLSIPLLDAMIKTPDRGQTTDSNLVLDDLDAKVASSIQAIEELRLRQSNVSVDDRAELLEFLRDKLSGSLAKDVEDSLRQKIAENSSQAYLRSLFRRHADFLLREIAALTRRANVNLVIGVLTTLLAAGMLAYMVASVAVRFDGLQHLLEHYIPRVTTVIFIEVFSFFFLKLYRSNLSEIRYYENELTNLVLHESATEAAFQSKDSGILAQLAERFSQANRNGQVNVPAGSSVEELKGVAEVVDRIANTVVRAMKKG